MAQVGRQGVFCVEFHAVVALPWLADVARFAMSLTGNREELIDALALNPLVSSRDQAARLVVALL